MSRLCQDSINKMSLLDALMVDMTTKYDSKIFCNLKFMADEERTCDIIFSTCSCIASSIELSGKEIHLAIKQDNLTGLLKLRCMHSLYSMKNLIEDELEKLEKR